MAGAEHKTSLANFGIITVCIDPVIEITTANVTTHMDLSEEIRTKNSGK